MGLFERYAHSFIVNIRLEETAADGGQAIWRGYVTHVPSGRRRYVADLDDITAFIRPYLEAMGVDLPPGRETRRLPPYELPPSLERRARAEAARRGVVLPMTPPPLDQALSAMLAELDDYLPPPSGALPDPSVAIAQATERPVGLGNRRGMETRASFAAVELKGIRVDAVVRYQIWDAGPAQVAAAMGNLTRRLLAARDELWGVGFLRLELAAVPLAEHVPALSAWRQQADVGVLYEFRYQETVGVESLIARIPIHSDPEVRGSPDRETTEVTDEMVRWDDETASPLVVRGRGRVAQIAALAFVPGPPPAGTVDLIRTFDGAVDPTPVHPDLATFLAAVGGPSPVARQGQTTFASLGDFLGTFSAAGSAIDLGDWDVDGIPDSYAPRILTLSPAIHLPSTADRLEIAHQNTEFDQIAIVYLRARNGGAP